MRLRLVVLALFSCLLTNALAEEHTVKGITKQPLSVSEAAARTPQTLEQMPAVPPQVTYQGGQLTITVRNSTLGDILKAVHAQTGAEIDLPGPGNERVVGSFGPGPARDVLAALLYGSHFNYVLLGSETDPQSLNRVMLFVKTAASESAPEETASAAAYQGNNNPAVYYGNAARGIVPPRPGMPTPGAANQQAADTAEDADAQADDDSADADDQTDDQADDQSAETEVQGEEPAQVKSPEQMLQELQQQQQQQSQPGMQPGFPGGMRPGFPPGVQPGVPPGQGAQQQQQ
jgi:hypothetical protein